MVLQLHCKYWFYWVMHIIVNPTFFAALHISISIRVLIEFLYFTFKILAAMGEEDSEGIGESRQGGGDVGAGENPRVTHFSPVSY